MQEVHSHLQVGEVLCQLCDMPGLVHHVLGIWSQMTHVIYNQFKIMIS